MTRLPVGVMRARFILFYFKTPTIGSPIPREFLLKLKNEEKESGQIQESPALRERLFFLVEVRRKPKFFFTPHQTPKKKRRQKEKRRG